MAYLGRTILDEVAGFTAVLTLNVTTATTSSSGLGTVTNVVTVSVAVRAGNLGLLHDLLLFGASLCGVTSLLAVGAVGLEVVAWEPSILKALEVLFKVLGPTFSQNGTTGLGGLLEGNLILLVRVTLEVDVGVDRRGDSLLLGNEVPLEASLTEALFELNKGKLRGDLAVDPEGLVEVVDISMHISENQVVPSLVSVVGKGKTIRVDVVLLSASSSGVASAGTLLANGLSTLCRMVTFGTTSAAGASKGTFDLGVRTVGLVVTNFAAVETLTSHLTWLVAITREVTRLAAAARLLAETWKVYCANDLLAAGVIAGVVLGN